MLVDTDVFVLLLSLPLTKSISCPHPYPLLAAVPCSVQAALEHACIASHCHRLIFPLSCASPTVTVRPYLHLPTDGAIDRCSPELQSCSLKRRTRMVSRG